MTKKACELCGQKRGPLDQARIDGKPYCHGDDDAYPTCYTLASWGARRAAADLPVQGEQRS